jgi:hypothetical protein
MLIVAFFAPPLNFCNCLIVIRLRLWVAIVEKNNLEKIINETKI